MPLGPGGAYAKQIAAHNVIAIVGDTVFAHGGVLGDWVTHVDEVNLATRCWLDGQAGGADARALGADLRRQSGVDPRGGTRSVDCAKVATALDRARRQAHGRRPHRAGPRHLIGV